MLSLSTVKKIAYVYLVIPVIIFSLGWLNTVVAMVFCVIVIAGLISLWKKEASSDGVLFQKWNLILVGAVLFLWVYLSGIGGYTFQNWDHHSRNAVFRDLVNYSWPVAYHLDPNVAFQFKVSTDVILSYYFGFWLPAALVGKMAGWAIANLFLFVWSLLGVILAVILTAFNTKLSLLKTALLVIFFSGMDIVGAWFLQSIPGYTYPGIWPPIQHLEWWAGSLQYPSFTTDLFWTYNQFIPTFLLVSLFVCSTIDTKFFILGICSFFAPFPALGLAPFVFGGAIVDLVSLQKPVVKSYLSYTLRRLLTLENLAGVVIALIALTFYSTNLSAQSRVLRFPAPFLLYLIFLLLEGMIIWLFLLPEHGKDWQWYVVGIILFMAPFIKVGESWDFMLRTTLPAFYLLMVGVGSFITKIKRSNLIFAPLSLMLILGSLTPIYEMNRSIVRTDRYYGYPFLARDPWEDYFMNPPATIQTFVPEFDHLDTLIADDWGSVSKPNSVGWNTKVGEPFSSRLVLVFRKELAHGE